MGGTPSLPGGTPEWGTPCPDLARGYPVLGYPPGRDLGPVTGVPPRKDMGAVEVLWDGNGVNPPPPPPRCGQTDTCENSVFPSYYVRGR